MSALVHGRELQQSSTLLRVLGITEKTSAVVEIMLLFQWMDVVNEVHELAHPFVYVIVLQLNEASADGSNVALLIGEGHAAGSLWVFELRVGVNASVANTSVQPVHDHSQFHLREEGRRKDEEERND